MPEVMLADVTADQVAHLFAGSVDADTHRRVEQFFAREAMLLEHRLFDAWLDLLASDFTYTMETVVNAYGRHARNRPEKTYLFCDTKPQMTQRVARLKTGIAWSEEPPSRTRRLITNVIATRVDDDLLQVHSNFLVFRSRQESDNTIYVGGRVDHLRIAVATMTLASRTVTLDQAVLQAHNLSIFF